MEVGCRGGKREGWIWAGDICVGVLSDGYEDMKFCFWRWRSRMIDVTGMHI